MGKSFGQSQGPTSNNGSLDGTVTAAPAGTPTSKKIAMGIGGAGNALAAYGGGSQAYRPKPMTINFAQNQPPLNAPLSPAKQNPFFGNNGY